MTETGLVLRQNNDRIVEFLTLLRRERDEMDFLIERQKEEQGKIQNDIEKLTFKLSLLSKSLNQRIKARNDYEATIKEVEQRYKELVEASGKLLATVENKAERLDEIMDKKIGTIEEVIPKEAFLTPMDNPPDNCITDTPQKPLEPKIEPPKHETPKQTNRETSDAVTMEPLVVIKQKSNEDEPNIFADLTEHIKDPPAEPIEPTKPNPVGSEDRDSNHSFYDPNDLPAYDRVSHASVDSSDRSLVLDEPRQSLDEGRKRRESVKPPLPQPITKGHDEAVQAFRDAYGRQHAVPTTPASLRKFDAAIEDRKASRRSTASGRSAKRDYD